MSHRCDTPSKYSPQFVYGGFRCQTCGQRWMFLPNGPALPGGWGRVAVWTKVGWWRYNFI